MNIEAPVSKLVGRPTLIVTHANGVEETRTVANAPLKKIFDAILAGSGYLSIYPVVKVGIGTTPNSPTTAAMELPIKPAGANYNLNSAKSTSVSPRVMSPDGKTLSYTYSYIQTFNIGAIVGLITEVGLDTRNKTTNGEVDFRAVLDSGVNVYSDSQLKVIYSFDISVTIGNPFVKSINVSGVPTDFTITPTFMLGTTLEINQILAPPSTLWVEDLDTISSGYLWRTGQNMSVSGGNGVIETVPDSSKVAVRYNSTGNKCNTTSGTIKWIAFNDQRPLVGYKFDPPLPKSTLQSLKLRIVFDYDGINPWYTGPVVPEEPPEDAPDVIPTNLVDTDDTGHTLQSLGPSGLDYPYQIVRANDEIEVLFFPGGPNYRPNTSVQVEGTDVWASSTITPINFGFGMWGIDGSTDNMLDHYNCYVELIDGASVKRAKLVINFNPEDPTFKWFTYAKETSPGLFSKTDYFFPEYVDLYDEYINETGGFKYAFSGGLPAVDETYFGLNPGALWLVSMFNPAGTVWETPISGKTVTFRLKAIPKTEGKTPVQLSVDVHFDIPKPETPPAGETSTPSTGHEWTSSQVVANAPAVETRANDEVEVCFGSTNGVRTGDTWTGNGDTMDIAWGFGMYNNFNMVTEDMSDRYDFYLELVHNGVTKRAKMVKVAGIEYPWTYLQYETSPGVFGATEYIYGFESFSTSHKVSATEYNVKGEQAKGYFTTTVTGVDPELSEIEQLPFVVRAFYQDTKVLPFDIHNATLQFKVRAVPKDSAKTEVLYIATVVLT